MAGYHAGCIRIDDLTLEAPLVLPAKGSVQLRVTAGAPDESGRRTLEVHSRVAQEDAERPWTRHATGLLAPATPARAADDAEFVTWPPEGAVPVDIDGFYDAAAAGGYGFGPAFRGLKAAWRRGGDVFAEAVLPEDASGDAGAFALHPALLDAAQQAGVLVAGAAEGETWLSFGWNGITLEATGARTLRVRLGQDADGGFSMTATDASGARVLSVDSLLMRKATMVQEAATSEDLRDSLFAVDWTPVADAATAPGGRNRWAVLGADAGLTTPLVAAGVDVRNHADLDALGAAVEGGELLPDVVLAAVTGPDPAEADAALAARALTGQVLDLVQRWLVEDRLGSARLAIVSRGAMSAAEDDAVTDPAAAAVWGLVRSAQSEDPDRLILLDLPAELDGATGLIAAALGSGEAELAIRDGAVLTRRLARPAPGLLVPEDGGPWRLGVRQARRGGRPGARSLPGGGRTARTRRGARRRTRGRAAGPGRGRRAARRRDRRRRRRDRTGSEGPRAGRPGHGPGVRRSRPAHRGRRRTAGFPARRLVVRRGRRVRLAHTGGPARSRGNDPAEGAGLGRAAGARSVPRGRA